MRSDPKHISYTARADTGKRKVRYIRLLFKADRIDDPSNRPEQTGALCTNHLCEIMASPAPTDDPLETFGTRAVVQVPRLRSLMQLICRNGFEHHAALTSTHCALPVAEALGNYLGWDIHHHNAPDTSL